MTKRCHQSPVSAQRRVSAFTLAEVIISVGLLAIGLLAVIGLFTAALKLQNQSQQRAEALALARALMERVRSEPNTVPTTPGSWIGGEFASTPLVAGPPAFPPNPYPFQRGYSLDVHLENSARPDMKLVRIAVRWDDAQTIEVQTLIRN